MSYLIFRGGTTTLTVSAFWDFISFSTRVESPGLFDSVAVGGC